MAPSGSPATAPPTTDRTNVPDARAAGRRPSPSRLTAHRGRSARLRARAFREGSRRRDGETSRVRNATLHRHLEQFTVDAGPGPSRRHRPGPSCPYELGSEPGSAARRPLYSYRPLTGEFIAPYRQPLGPAVELRPGRPRAVRVRGARRLPGSPRRGPDPGRPPRLAQPALAAYLRAVYHERTEFGFEPAHSRPPTPSSSGRLRRNDHDGARAPPRRGARSRHHGAAARRRPLARPRRALADAPPRPSGRTRRAERARAEASIQAETSRRCRSPGPASGGCSRAAPVRARRVRARPRRQGRIEPAPGGSRRSSSGRPRR